MMFKKTFIKTICITLMVTFLTLSVGKVTRVSAMGATIAAASAAALLSVGIVYCSYMALTGAAVHVPDTVEHIEEWLKDMGSKVVQYPSGRAAYEELYPDLLSIGDEPLSSLLDHAWTWTSDKLKAWCNDFSNTDTIIEIGSYTATRDITYLTTNGFAYSNLTHPPFVTDDGYTFIDLVNQGYTITPFGDVTIAIGTSDGRTLYDVSSLEASKWRNLLKTNGLYYMQELVNGEWVQRSPFFYLGYSAVKNNVNRMLYPNYNYYNLIGASETYINDIGWTYPKFVNLPIHDEATDTDLPLVIPDSLVTYKPQYPSLPPEHDNKPIIPYIQLPFDPNWIDPNTGLPGGGDWGFKLADLLDKIESLAELLLELGAIADLINEFKNLLSGTQEDNYYIYFNEGDDYYYQYYTITNYGDNIYNYNIDVSDVDEHLPVDLNSVSTYTHNRYIDTVKQSAQNGSSLLRDFAVFWHDVDPQITYVVFGCAITLLLAAFIGKWGHS